jgi:hypothetical protein
MGKGSMWVGELRSRALQVCVTLTSSVLVREPTYLMKRAISDMQSLPSPLDEGVLFLGTSEEGVCACSRLGSVLLLLRAEFHL